jgi:hypothetical protein
VEPSTENHLSGIVSGHAVQAGVIHGDVHFHATPAEATEVHPPPADWTELPVLPVRVQSLLRAQVQAAQELPYRLPGARRPSLETVHVRQDLGSGGEEPPSEHLRPTPVLDSHGQLVDLPSTPVVRQAVRPPSRTVREALDANEHLLVTAGPGQGKSTLSLRLAADVATRWTSPAVTPLAEPVVPLRLTARELASRLDLPFPQALAAAVGVEYGALLLSAVDERTLAERVVGCRWLLLVDGLDEVADSVDRDRLVTVLAAWTSAESPYRVVLTTRPIEGAALAPLQRIGAARYELQPFDDEALGRFADNWFDDGDDAARFIRQVRAAHLDELVRVPLLATIAAIIFEQHDDRPLPDNQYELYEAYLKYLRCGHQVAPNPLDQSREALLEHLGRTQLETDTSLLAAAVAWTGATDEELIAYLTAVGPFTRRGSDLRFLHHSFAEHLAATAMARLLPERFDPEHEDFVRLVHAAQPDERGRRARAVLLHHTRLHPAEADRQLRWLHTGHHLLAARLLARHLPASAEAVDEFLTTVRAWAMSTQYPGREILSQTSRAAHHPGLHRWLADLMRDEQAPWQSRVEAATALATRLRGAYLADAVAELHATVDDTAATVEHRLAAAEALAECGSGDQEAADRGLRSVLANPLATGSSCRTAAVVLAGFGGTARVHAVEALTRLLDDPCTPDPDLVEAATGLVEIGVEFHERCAEVFRTLLRRRVDLVSFRDTAIGLASLGSSCSAEAITTLTGFVTNLRLDHVERTRAAEVLAELGPQHRVVAGKLLLAAAEPGVNVPDRFDYASALNRLGGEFQQHAAALLRSVLADRTVGANTLLWTAWILADLGPAHHAEAARALHRVASHPLADIYDRPVALGRLADLGDPHRGPAVAALRADLEDRGIDPECRYWAANELARLGPDFHPEVCRHLLEIASGPSGHRVRLVAWRQLATMGAESRCRALAALLGLMGDDYDPRGPEALFHRVDTDVPHTAAGVLGQVLAESSRTTMVRMRAAQSLVNHGRSFHRIAVDGMADLIRSGSVPRNKLRLAVRYFANVGSALRSELALVLRDVAVCPQSLAEHVWQAAEAMRVLGHGDDPGVLAALHTVMADESENWRVRGQTSVTLARADPQHLSDATAVILRIDAEHPRLWASWLCALAVLGADLAPGVRSLLEDSAADRGIREQAASTLAQLRPDLAGEALRELRRQAADEYLKFMWRTDVVLEVTRFAPDTVDTAIAFHLALLNDERELIAHRCKAACQLVKLDPSLGRVAVAALRRFAMDSGLMPAEQQAAVDWLKSVTSLRPAEVFRLALAVAHDPAAGHSVRTRLVDPLSGTARSGLERSLLADRTIPIERRVPDADVRGHRPLALEAEQAVRDVLTAPETRPAERVAAAATLGRLSHRFTPEATGLLDELSRGRCAALKARRELAELGGVWRGRVLADARDVLDDETRPWRERLTAASFLADFLADPGRPVLDLWRTLAQDERMSARARVRIRYVLRRADGLDAVRGILNDEQAEPAIRWTAAKLLLDHDVADRAVAARVLDAIASDATCRPALRWRVAETLADFGARGRELAAHALRAIVDDTSLPVPSRANAARVLGLARPDLRVEVVQVLRGLKNAGPPLHRKLVLEAIGLFNATEGVLGLRDLAENRALGPVVRIRCAEAMAELRRDYREAAAAVAREVAHDSAVPVHVRVRAARDLARWSDLCRGEAQELLGSLMSFTLNGTTAGAEE